MNIQESNDSQKKEALNDENNNNKMDSALKEIEDSAAKTQNEKSYHHKEKDKIKNTQVKKTNNENDIIKETKIVKIRNLIDDEFINDYNPEIQNNAINPKLNFFVDCESVSESDKDLSSASLSKDGEEEEQKEQKDVGKKNT